LTEKIGRRVISVSPKKNIEMVVYHNTNEQGVKQSITRHERLNPERPAYRRAFGRP
jgi:hypothetical protein